jgi:hypothetical protein
MVARMPLVKASRGDELVESVAGGVQGLIGPDGQAVTDGRALFASLVNACRGEESLELLELVAGGAKSFLDLEDRGPSYGFAACLDFCCFILLQKEQAVSKVTKSCEAAEET